MTIRFTTFLNESKNMQKNLNSEDVTTSIFDSAMESKLFEDDLNGIKTLISEQNSTGKTNVVKVYNEVEDFVNKVTSYYKRELGVELTESNNITICKKIIKQLIDGNY